MDMLHENLRIHGMDMLHGNLRIHGMDMLHGNLRLLGMDMLHGNLRLLGMDVLHGIHWNLGMDILHGNLWNLRIHGQFVDGWGCGRRLRRLVRLARPAITYRVVAGFGDGSVVGAGCCRRVSSPVSNACGGTTLCPSGAWTFSWALSSLRVSGRPVPKAAPE
ncbi:hypothetical protein [Arthrobacter sp. H16F315]|uniref:hypothetical protein n=1 Tax=Arthrobacter sp. H16F315 TaxID=2955314 RepID=UPI002098647F|nr:hypothetical protein [Arthrobacter sp. H16F315]MDD1477477.1 hypothetical protein [Arthrobacter sp. H16F315]